MNMRECKVRVERNKRESETKSQSFSSSLLDEIYRSIDDGADKRSGELKFYRHKMSKKHVGKPQSDVGDDEMGGLQRALLIEKWIEKKVGERRRSECDKKFQTNRDDDREDDSFFFSSNSSSSDSSFGGFSSSDTESMFGPKSLTPSCFAKLRPKQIRTSVSAPPEKQGKTETKQKNTFIDKKYSGDNAGDFDENGMIKSKSRALKIYNNLKKVKQPISPGGRLSSFINSLFTSGNQKKTKNCVIPTEDLNTERKSKSGQTSTCSSAASFSRSCLSKTPPCSTEKLQNGNGRTVRFYPVSTIVDEYCRPCGHKSLHEEDIKLQVKDKIHSTEAAARQFFKEYHQNKKKKNLKIRNFHHTDNDEQDEDEDNDRGSCSSSDLFELDHLSVLGGGVGGDRYREELPVYETTTRVNTNRAIRHCY